MKTSELIENITKALFDLQGELKPVPRSKVVKVKSFEFRYAPLDAITEYITPLMQRHGLAFLQAVDSDCLTTRIIHKSGQWIESNTFLNKEHANMQGFGGEITYKRRYSLCSLLGVVSDDDVDVPISLSIPARPSTESLGLDDETLRFIEELVVDTKEMCLEGRAKEAVLQYRAAGMIGDMHIAFQI